MTENLDSKLMSKKKWNEIEAALGQLAGEAAEGVEQLRGKSGTRARPLDEDDHTQTQVVFNRFGQDDEQSRIHSSVFNRLIGSESPKAPPPDDMPALEKIKLYARSGYHQHHIGTDEDFERVWEEAFKKESKYQRLLDSLHEKGGKE